MKLTTILDHLTEVIGQRPKITAEYDISGIQHDSRLVEPNDLFVCLVGDNSDGHDYIDAAIARGAAAVIGQRDQLQIGVPYVAVANSRIALAEAAATLYDWPARQLGVVGVTGTDGKTTTLSFIHAILNAAGLTAGSVTTIGAKLGDETTDLGVHVSTPDAPTVQRQLATMVDSGMVYALLEATSHGLAQYRVHACEFDVAVITNITHEHLDYHGTIERYRADKARLFDYLGNSQRKRNRPKIAVLNADDPAYDLLASYPADVHWSYALEKSADFTASQIQHTIDGSTFTAHTPVGAIDIHLPLPGRHNVANALAAIAVAVSQYVPTSAIQRGLDELGVVHGRMQPVACGQSFAVYADYAHTANALVHVLQTASLLTEGRVIAVCGLSGGLRDKSKRQEMGDIVGRLADQVVLTAMDWYDEDVDSIIDGLAVGCLRAGKQYGIDLWRERERRTGIERAIQLAQPGDLVLVTGKAHERSLARGGVESEWNEIDEIQAALQRRLDGATV